VELYKAGKSFWDVAQAHNLTHQRIREIVRRWAPDAVRPPELRRKRRRKRCPVGRPRKIVTQQSSKLLEETKPTTKAAVQERINQLTARVDEFVAAAAQPPVSEVSETNPPLTELETSKNATPEPRFDPTPDPNAGLDPKDPRPWPCETAWMQRHWPKGVSAELADRLTECYHFLMRYGVPRGTDVYFELLERRMGIHKPNRRTK
jgi:hypothetical protein